MCLRGDTGGLENYSYPNLRKLSLRTYDARDPEQEVFLELTGMFPSLTGLDIDGVKLKSPSWSTLFVHPHLKNLSLRKTVIKASSGPGFWEACRKLESLTLDDVIIHCGAIPAGVVFDSLRTLTMTTNASGVLSTQDQLDLTLRCPNLKELYWTGYRDVQDRVHPPFNTGGVLKGCWPHLRQVNISLFIRDKDVASLLKGIGDGRKDLVDLELYGCFLGDQVSKAFHRHFSTLVELNLTECLSVNSCTIRDLLCYCPRLEVLLARSILARDVVAAGPWVCLQLRELMINFLFGESELDLQHEIFRRLSTLTLLRRLILFIPVNEPYEENCTLELRLENGLGQLSSLQQLTKLDFDGSPISGFYIPELGKEEALWILTNWKKLESISGPLNTDPDVEQTLRDALKLFGAQVK
jgi:hypothetical protein